jgi:hypothetical protein
MDPIAQTMDRSTVALMTGHTATTPTRAPRNPLADLVGLTDKELRGLTTQLSSLGESEPADFDGMRRILADWALTVRIRSHPDFGANAAAFSSALERRADPVSA